MLDTTPSHRFDFSLGIVDSSPLFFQVLHDWLRRHAPEVRVIGATTDVGRLLRDDRPTPDVVLLGDVAYRPGWLQWSTERCTRTGAHVVVLTHDRVQAREAIGATPHAVVLTRMTGAFDLLEELRLAAARRDDARAPRRVVRLSERERHAMRLADEGLTYRAIGEQMHVSPETVKTFLRRARAKYRAAGQPLPGATDGGRR